MKMLKLNRFKLINWHFIDNKTIQFGEHNMIAGPNGSGKTTIVDALQIVFVGALDKNLYNKSANGKSDRDVKGYLRCETGTDSEGSPKYKRKGDFSSYLVAEIDDDVNDLQFCIGIIFDSYADFSFNNKFFYYEGVLLENGFLTEIEGKTGKYLMNIKTLKNFFLKNNPEAKFTMFESNTSYREFIKSKFGNIAEGYFDLFKKAIPFKPIENKNQLVDFISEFICDVSKEIDLDKLKENFRSYSQLEIETVNLKKRIDLLSNACTTYDTLSSLRQEQATKRYIFKKANLNILSQRYDYLETELRSLQEELKEEGDLLTYSRTQIADLGAQKDSLIGERGKSDTFSQKETIQSKIDVLNNKIANYEALVERYLSALISTKVQWLETLKKADGLFKSFNDNEILNQVSKLKNLLLNISEDQFLSFTTESLNQIHVLFSNIKSTVRKNQSYYHSEYHRLLKERQILQQQQSFSDEGKILFPENITAFQRILKEELSELYNEDVKAPFLAELIEVKNEKWRKLIEFLLGQQRFYIFVDSKYAESALNIFYAHSRELNLFNTAVIDSERYEHVDARLANNPLSSQLSTSNKIARNYLETSIGSYEMVETDQELRKFPRAACHTGNYYTNGMARTIDHNVRLYIGKNVNKLNQKDLINDLQKIEHEFIQAQNFVYAISEFESLSELPNNDINTIMSLVNDDATNRRNIQNIEQHKDILNSIGTDNYFASLNKQIEKISNEISELKLEEEEHIKKLSKLEEEIARLSGPDKLNILQSRDQLLKELDDEFQDSDFRNLCEAEFFSELNRLKDATTIYSTYRHELDGYESRLNDLERKVVQDRTMYQAQYDSIFDINNVFVNTEYQDELTYLVDTKLVEFQDKIKEAKMLAMRQFKDNLLGKLKNNFDTIKMQISLINRALLASQFGEDSYYFIAEPNRLFRRFYDMINDPMLIEDGVDVFSDKFQQKYSETFNELFQIITVIDSSSVDMTKDMEENIKKYTDYRSYLDLDIVVSKSNNPDPNIVPDRLSTKLGKSSGGEVQTPFYISVLASFAQTYGIIDNPNANSLRLVLFDEAFSKMDSQRMKEAVKLLENYHLQGIVVVPGGEEKLREVTDFIDQTILVWRDKEGTHVTPFKKGVKK
jgi:energy-coupling factor transporter ATP-binding protein EcfA2